MFRNPRTHSTSGMFRISHPIRDVPDLTLDGGDSGTFRISCREGVTPECSGLLRPYATSGMFRIKNREPEYPECSGSFFSSALPAIHPGCSGSFFSSAAPAVHPGCSGSAQGKGRSLRGIRNVPDGGIKKGRGFRLPLSRRGLRPRSLSTRCLSRSQVARHGQRVEPRGLLLVGGHLGLLGLGSCRTGDQHV
jgi:hypothetical protein